MRPLCRCVLIAVWCLRSCCVVVCINHLLTHARCMCYYERFLSCTTGRQACACKAQPMALSVLLHNCCIVNQHCYSGGCTPAAKHCAASSASYAMVCWFIKPPMACRPQGPLRHNTQHWQVCVLGHHTPSLWPLPQLMRCNQASPWVYRNCIFVAAEAAGCPPTSCSRTCQACAREAAAAAAAWLASATAAATRLPCSAACIVRVVTSLVLAGSGDCMHA